MQWNERAVEREVLLFTKSSGPEDGGTKGQDSWAPGTSALDSLERMLTSQLWKASYKSLSLGVSGHVYQLDLFFKSSSDYHFITQTQPKLLWMRLKKRADHVPSLLTPLHPVALKYFLKALV